MMIANRVSALAVAAVLGFAATADAQTPPPSPAAGTIAPAPWAPGMRPRQPMQQAVRLRALHDALNIRPDQEQAFQAFAASMRPEGPAEGQASSRPNSTFMRPDPQAMAGMTTPERLDLIGRMMDDRISRMRDQFQRHATALKALYAVLGPDQRRTLDALPDLMGHGGMGMGMGPYGGWGMGPKGGRGMNPPGAMGMAPPGDHQ